jgi:hypothetical protein
MMSASRATFSTSNTTATETADTRKPKHSIHWFRKGLRVHDNPALLEAVKEATTFRCIYILDPWFVGASNTSGIRINKWRFLLQSLEDLDLSLRRLSSRLFVVKGHCRPVYGKGVSTDGRKFHAGPAKPDPYTPCGRATPPPPPNGQQGVMAGSNYY